MNQCIRTTASPETDQPKRKPRGFTLLEVILGLGLITMLIGGIYSIATASLQLSNTVLENQQEDMHMHAFINLLRRNLQSLPGNATVSMEEANTSGGVYQSEMVLTDYPLAFAWGSVAAGSKKVLLVFRVRYLNDEEVEAYDSGNLGPNDGISLVLIDSLRGVLWEFYNQQTDEWLPEWIQPNQRPTMLRLSLDFYAVEEPMTIMFWIPTVANPAQIASTAGQTPGGQPGGGPGGQPGGPDIQVPPPGGGGRGGGDAGRGGGRSPQSRGGTVPRPASPPGR
jgi:prepilin-type N-terminal cleavage/methylation domain-containing protein